MWRYCTTVHRTLTAGPPSTLYSTYFPRLPGGGRGEAPDRRRPLSALTHLVIPGDHKMPSTSNDLIVCPSSKLILIETVKVLKVLDNFLIFLTRKKLQFCIFLDVIT